MTGKYYGLFVRGNDEPVVLFQRKEPVDDIILSLPADLRGRVMGAIVTVNYDVEWLFTVLVDRLPA
jgi:hypothetical protein